MKNNLWLVYCKNSLCIKNFLISRHIIKHYKFKLNVTASFGVIIWINFIDRMHKFHSICAPAKKTTIRDINKKGHPNNVSNFYVYILFRPYGPHGLKLIFLSTQANVASHASVLVTVILWLLFCFWWKEIVKFEYSRFGN